MNSLTGVPALLNACELVSANGSRDSLVPGHKPPFPK